MIIVFMTIYVVCVLALDVMFVIYIVKKKNNKSTPKNIINTTKIFLMLLMLSIMILAVTYSVSNNFSIVSLLLTILGIVIGSVLPPWGIGIIYDVIFIYSFSNDENKENNIS